MDRKEILETLAEIYTNLVYGSQTEEKYAIKIGEIAKRLEEY